MWWEWELGFTPHIEARMEERDFSEVELRTMLDSTTDLVSPSCLVDGSPLRGIENMSGSSSSSWTRLK